MPKLTIPDILAKKGQGEKITMLTAYDYPMAKWVDQAGIDMVLVGDSLGMVMLGYSSTVPVTMREMLHHCRAVRQGVEHALVVGDMPFMSFNVSREQTLRNAGRFLKEGGCDAVKVEAGQDTSESIAAVEVIASAGIPVLGHVGLTPQTAAQLGGYKVQGKTAEAALALVDAAQKMEAAGAFGVVLECVPAQVASLVTERLSVPTIGIGAGSDCDGQVLVIHDLVQMTDKQPPKFVRPFAQVGQAIQKASEDFRKAVASGDFPGKEESYALSKAEWERLNNMLNTQDKAKTIQIGRAQ